MFEQLELPAGLVGRVVRHSAGDVHIRAHRHTELEVNLVVRGCATYLLGQRRYELAAGTLTWLFPGQEHILVDQSDDHQLWWAVFTPSLVAQIAQAPHTRTLAASDPEGSFSRHISATQSRALQSVFATVLSAESRDHVLANAGLGYLLCLAWRVFLESDDLVDSFSLHPAVRTVAQALRTDPAAGGLASLGRMVGLSATHLSRLFSAEAGIPLSRYRNQQRLQRFLLNYADGEHTTALTAARRAGFGSYAQFYRVLKHETGRTPATLRTRAGAHTDGSGLR
jgi:AraC-like DNA-binding protein